MYVYNLMSYETFPKNRKTKSLLKKRKEKREIYNTTNGRKEVSNYTEYYLHIAHAFGDWNQTNHNWTLIPKIGTYCT